MTAIEWTQRPGTKGETWNPIRARNKATGGIGHFCEHASEACRFCYSETWQPRFKNPIRFARQDRDKVDIFLDEKALVKPLHWRDPRTVFVCSMTDIAADFVPDDWLDRILAVAALTPQHTYQILTKRPERMRSYIETPNRSKRIAVVADREISIGKWKPRREGAVQIRYRLNDRSPRRQQTDGLMQWPLQNVWLGTSVEDQATADARIPHLLATPAAIRFVSYEPALGPVDFTRLERHDLGENSPPTIVTDALGGMAETFSTGQQKNCSRLGWIIAGGESGLSARPPHPDWFRSARDQCAAAGVAFFFKQWGEWAPDEPSDWRQRNVPTMSVRPVPHARSGDVGGPGWPINCRMYRVGKKHADAVLDGQEHCAWPEVTR